jgi:GDP-D-mannose 3',5'-epimerase
MEMGRDLNYRYESPDEGKSLYRILEGSENRERVGNQSKQPIGDRKTALVLGAGGFIGSHMVKRLKSEGYWVRGVDLKLPEFGETQADDYFGGDLTYLAIVNYVFSLGDEWNRGGFDEVYQFAADMGGAGYIFTGENDANVMHNSGLINLNVAKACVEYKVGKIFYSSSACMYPAYNQEDPDNPNCKEDSAYPAQPDSEYGWEKLFSERLYKSFERNYGLNVRIARFHNIFGPEGTWDGGKEKAPAAMCRKAIMSDGDIEVWGDGKQTRSFLYIDECIEAVRRLMESDYTEPVNIGSEEMIAINDFAQMAIDISDKDIKINNLDGEEFEKKYGHPVPLGVKGRNSDNTLFEEKVGWKPSKPLIEGMRETYKWIKNQVEITSSYKWINENSPPIDQWFRKNCENTSDIHEHLPVIKKYAKECDHITEMGVRWIVSTWALLSGRPKKMISIDYENPSHYGGNINDVYEAVKGENIDFHFQQADTRKIEIEPTDLLFIDTEHNYDQLKAELEIHPKNAKKYMMFHDTVSFGRRGMDGKDKGLMDAIEEFLENNKEWKIKEHYENNNGLLIMERTND